MVDLSVTIGGFVILLVLLVALRIKTKNRLEIKSSDIVLALIPVALWLFMTGKLKVIEFGGLKMESAFVQASQQAVATEVDSLPVEPIEASPKGSIGQIDHLIALKSRALSFQLGYGGYVGFAIGDYLKRLTARPFLQYLVINNQDGSFFGMADARQTERFIANGQLSPDMLAQWLNQGDRRSLADRLPGWVGARDALQSTVGRREALEKMDNLNAETLPVAEAGMFVGVVERSRVTAGMLVEIARKLQ